MVIVLCPICLSDINIEWEDDQEIIQCLKCNNKFKCNVDEDPDENMYVNLHEVR